MLPILRPRCIVIARRLPILQMPVRYSHDNPFPTISEFEAKWTKFFTSEAYDQFELQRGLNHSFHFDIVPTIPVLEAALRACRKLNDLAAAMRIFGALRQKCSDDAQYEEYVKYLEPIKKELGVSAPEDIGRI